MIGKLADLFRKKAPEKPTLDIEQMFEYDMNYPIVIGEIPL